MTKVYVVNCLFSKYTVQCTAICCSRKFIQLNSNTVNYTTTRDLYSNTAVHNNTATQQPHNSTTKILLPQHSYTATQRYIGTTTVHLLTTLHIHTAGTTTRQFYSMLHIKNPDLWVWPD